jgi:hypothetical protein
MIIMPVTMKIQLLHQALIKIIVGPEILFDWLLACTDNYDLREEDRSASVIARA